MSTAAPADCKSFSFNMFIVYLLLVVFAAITLVPFVYLLFSAFKSQDSFFSFVLWPTNGAWYDVDWDGFTLSHWRTLFVEAGILRATVNSFFISSVTAILATLFSAMGGYALAKYRFPAERSRPGWSSVRWSFPSRF